jgi:hypothetical protein
VKNNIVDAYQNTGIIEPRNDFQEIYHQTLLTNSSFNNKYPLINLDDTISEYFNKYSKSQQRFLKNIYNFKNYFNQLNRYSNLNRILYKVNCTQSEAFSNPKSDYYDIVFDYSN